MDADGFVQTPLGRVWLLLPGAKLDHVPAAARQAARAVLRCEQAVMLLAPDAQTEEAMRDALLAVTMADEDSGAQFGHA